MALIEEGIIRALTEVKASFLAIQKHLLKQLSRTFHHVTLMYQPAITSSQGIERGFIRYIFFSVLMPPALVQGGSM